MIYALTEETARSAEERAVTELGVTLADLMQRAGSALAEEVALRAPYGAIAVIAGAGNNGGDGWVAAHRLYQAGREVTVFTPLEPDALIGIARNVAMSARDAGVSYIVHDGEMPFDALTDYPAIIDALFGIGFRAPMRPPFMSWIEAVSASGATVISADMPSGVDTDTGAVDGVAVHADVTVTFSAPKVGLLMYPGATHAGQTVVADIGIPWELLGGPGDVELWERADYATLVPRPARDAHKNSRGRVLVVAGSGNFPGAAVLAAMGAQRMGAGYVTLAVPESITAIVQAKLTSAVVVGLPENPSHTLASKVTDEILDVAKEFDAVVLGPGMTVAHGAVLVARKLVSELAAPLVLDADGLNALVDAAGALMARSAPTVVTPHPGELARLLETTSSEIQSNRLSYASRLAGPRFACVLKGAHTVIAGRGRRIVNESGGPALATAGTGDVLAGMVGALLAQGLEPLEAGALAAYVHGRAGDLAAATLTEISVVAEDVPAYVPAAVAELLGED